MCIGVGWKYSVALDGGLAPYGQWLALTIHPYDVCNVSQPRACFVSSLVMCHVGAWRMEAGGVRAFLCNCGRVPWNPDALRA